MNQKNTKTSQQLQELASFQEGFLALTHNQIYHSNLPIAESILKFQINHISEINEKFNNTIAILTRELIQKKTGYEGTLRDQFQNILQADYLPLLRINRYEITKLSLFGFDIYVEPLQAFLQILTRMQTLKQHLLKEGLQGQVESNAQAALEKGWDAYSNYAAQWKLSLNLYILKEYLMVGSKSFLRKDREILFTGINNFYNNLVPQLKAKNCQKLLLQLAQLNNSLYFFHPSFSYFQFYTLLLPLSDQLEPIFAFMKQVAQKCLRTNIITPLLFGILRNREAFLQFIKQADSPIWLPYINTIIAGIAINLKFRILQYEEILEIFEEAALKAGLLGAIRTDQVLGKLQQGWKDAKDFFISAVKIGFNSTEAETWKSVEFQTIGTRVIGSLLDGMLLGIQANFQNVKQYLQNGQEKLDNAVKSISNNKFDTFFIKSTICQLENNLTTQRQMFSLIHVCNLVKMLGIANEYTLNFIVASFNKMAIKPSKIVTLRLAQAAASVNQLLFQLGTPNLTFLKEKIATFHFSFPPKNNSTQLIDFYFSNFQPKKCLTHLLSFDIQNDKIEQYLLLVFNKFIPKPSNKRIILKTFDKQYATNNSFVNLPYQSHCFLNYTLSELAKGNNFAEIIIKTLIRECPWISFALLNFPINNNQDLLSFSSWLIDNKQYHNLLQNLIFQTKNTVLSQQGQDLIKILIYPSILDHLSKKINEVNEFQQLNCLCNLAINIVAQMEKNSKFSIDLLSILLHLLNLANEVKHIVTIVKNITILAPLGFQEKLNVWLNSLLLKRIQGRTQLSVGYRKRTLKTNHANIYFLGDISDYQKNQPYSINRQHQNNPINFSSDFEERLKKILSVNADQFQVLKDRQNIILLEQIKLFSVPTKDQIILKEIFSTDQQLTILFLSLNYENNGLFAQRALEISNINYLINQRFDKNLAKYVPRVLNLQRQQNKPILSLMSAHLSSQQKISISESFFLDESILPLYCELVQGIQYLTIFNNNNWRIVIEYFTRQFNSSNLPSIILQYHEFLNITGQKNGQYEKNIAKCASLFKNFTSLFISKIQSIFSVPYSQEELELRSANQISSLNMIISSIQLKQVLLKLANLNKTLKQKGIETLNQLVSITRRVNESINHHYEGDIILSNFIFSYKLTNQHVFQKLKTQIGVYLQKYYEITNDQDQYKHYLPSKLNQVELKTFQQYGTSNSIILQSDKTQQQINKAYIQIVKRMQQSQLLKLKGKTLEINCKKQFAQNDEKQFYVLGCYQSIIGDLVYEISNLLKAVTKRQKLPWQLLKQIDQNVFSKVIQIVNDPQISKRNLTFTDQGLSLIQQTQLTKVNQYNKLEYCNRIALSSIGESRLNCLKNFLRGYVYQLNHQ